VIKFIAGVLASYVATAYLATLVGVGMVIIDYMRGL
jgi:hypothetical protein